MKEDVSIARIHAVVYDLSARTLLLGLEGPTFCIPVLAFGAECLKIEVEVITFKRLNLM